MKAYQYFFILLLGIAISIPSTYAQKLSLGGKMGSTVIKSENSISTQASSAGFFATYKARKFKLGLQLEVNYLKWKENSENITHEFQLPVLGVLDIDRQKRISLHAGPYLGVGTVNDPTMSNSTRDWSWGLSSGARLRLPINENLSLIADTRLSCEVVNSGDHSYLQEGISTHNYSVPLQRRFTFNFSIGIDFKSGKRKAFRIKRETRRKKLSKD